MADNALQTVQKLLQDLIAPDVRETKVRLEALEKRMDLEFQSMRKENESFRNEMRSATAAIHSEIEAKFSAVMHAIADLKSSGEIVSLREIATLRERIAVLEASRNPQ